MREGRQKKCENRGPVEKVFEYGGQRLWDRGQVEKV